MEKNLVALFARAQGDNKLLSNYSLGEVVIESKRFPCREFLWPEDGELIRFPTALHAWNCMRRLVLAKWVKNPLRKRRLLHHAREFWKQPDTADELVWRTPRWARKNLEFKHATSDELNYLNQPKTLAELRHWQRVICVYKYRHHKAIRDHLESLPKDVYFFHHGGHRVNANSYWWGRYDRIHGCIVGHNAVGIIWKNMQRVHHRLKSMPDTWLPKDQSLSPE